MTDSSPAPTRRTKTAPAPAAKAKLAAAAAVEAESLRIAQAAARAADDARATDVVILDLRGVVDYADFAVIASCPSEARLTGVGKRVDKALRTVGASLLSSQGLGGGWMVFDAGDVVVHLFDLSLRDYYQLEHLWGDAPRIPLEPKPPSEE